MKDLAIEYYSKLHTIIKVHEPQESGLLGGRLGLALYYYTVYKATDDEQSGDRALAEIEQILETIDAGQPVFAGNSYAGGLAGFGYLLSYLQKEGFLDTDMQETFADIDKTLFETAMKQVSANQNDYLHGAMGTAFYFLNRLPDTAIESYLNELLNTFCSKAVHDAEGSWFRNVVVQDKDEKEINLSLSHGLYSFLLILIEAAEKGIAIKGLEELIIRCRKLLVSYRKETDFFNHDYTFYPSTINIDDRTIKNYTQRLAWCYGDLGAALFLIKAGNFLKDDHFVKTGNICAAASCMRKTLEHIVADDSHFCHGTAGTAHFYRHLWKLTGYEVYKNAYEHWIAETLRLLPGELEKNHYTGKECDLLEGLPGINLVLLSYLSERELNWSNALLL